MEVVACCVVDETLLVFGLVARLVLEYCIVVPPDTTHARTRTRTRTRQPQHASASVQVALDDIRFLE
jgi:hypothetical protein